MPGAGGQGTPRHGFVLHRRAWRESGFLLDLLTEEGLVRAVSRGSRGRAGVALQPFTPLAFWLRGRSDLQTLQQAEALAPPLRLSGPNLFCGMYLNEVLVLALRGHEPSEGLCERYEKTLTELMDAHADARERSLRRFEFSLLECLGYGLHLDHASDNGQPLTMERAYVVPLQGVFAQRPSVPAIEVEVETLRAVLDGALDSKAARHCAKRVARAQIDALVGGKKLWSRELFKRKT